MWWFSDSDLGKSVVYERRKIWIKYCQGVGMTNNSGFWIRWLDLLAFLYKCSQLWQLTISDCLRFIPFLAGLWMSSLLRDWFGSDLRVGHFSFRCPLVNTPQLNTQVLNSLTNESLEFTNVLSFITSGGPNNVHQTEQFVFWSVVRCSGNLVSRRLANGIPLLLLFRLSGGVYWTVAWQMVICVRIHFLWYK
jgi:hypothetical protein